MYQEFAVFRRYESLESNASHFKARSYGFSAGLKNGPQKHESKALKLALSGLITVRQRPPNSTPESRIC
jgi:hypothetical protein